MTADQSWIGDEVQMDMDDENDMIYDMQMVMSFTVKAGWVLWQKFDVQDGKTFFFAVLFIAFLALMTEILSYAIWLIQKSNSQNAKDGKSSVSGKVIQGVLFFILRLLNYSQMLIAMTFNFWLILFKFFLASLP